MIFALSIIPLMVAAGTGVDLARALVVRARLAEALDAAGLAVGASKGLTSAQQLTLAQNYFNANYTADNSFGTPQAVAITQGTEQISLTTNVAMPTTLMNVVGIKTLNVGYTSQVVWGQTKLWVSLVLDNTGSMTQTDSTGTSKISALKTATHQLLTTLQGAAATAGDVKVAIIPFSKDVNVGTSNSSATWIDWSDWQAAPSNGAPSTSVGPGSNCPYSNNSYGYTCQSTPTNGSSSTSTIASSGSYKGYICPGMDNGNKNSGRLGHYYNGCYNSVPTKTQTTTSSTPTTTTTNFSCTSNSNGNGSCTGSTSSNTSSSTGSTTNNTTTTNGYSGDSTSTSTSNGTPSTSKHSTSCKTKSGKTTCTTTWNTAETDTSTTTTSVGVGPYNHTWVANDQSTWSGCVMDRQQNYDISNTTPSNTATDYPAENSESCVPTVMLGNLSYDWTALSNEVDSMSAAGATNQPIGLAWGWQAQTDGDPLNSGSVPNNTSQYIILLSDGLNTQDRWYGDGSDQSSQVDGRMASLCTAAKNAGFTIYTIYVDLNGTQGNSTVLQNCATDSSKYFDLTTSGAIITTLNAIAEQITQLRVSQ
jgi:Flp pilus assembly protein TadG